jgi:hypothetical protein
MKRIFYSASVFISIIGTLFLSQLQTGCANIIPPTGGLKDTLPPVLLSASPKDSITNFHGKTITLNFDEFVQLDDQINQEFIVSPNPDNPPFPEAKLRTVTIKLRDSLKPNTTYSFDFGNGLRDLNEGNVLKNFTFVFSTGNTIASGSLSGNVTLAETGDTDSALIVLLHSNLNDSAVKKLKPDYYTRLDSSGNFHFRYLPSGRFNIYVLPNDYSKRYDDSTKMFAFYNTTVDPDSNNQRIKLYAYQQYKIREKTSGAPTAPTTKKGQTENKSLRITTSLENGQQDLLSDLSLTVSRKVTKYDSSKIILSDTNFNVIKGYTISHDTSFLDFSIHYNWQESEDLKLIIQKDAFEDSAGNTLAKNDTISFKTKKESDYGSIRLHFNNLDLSKNPVVQFVQDNKIVKAVPLTAIEWTQKLFVPGEYDLRVLYDENKNGVWDPGDFDKKLQPEIVHRIPRKLTIKSNWDNEVDINL